MNARPLRRAAHTTALALPRVLEVISVNDDFTDRWTDVPALARDRDPLAIGAQESKETDYRKRLGKQWGVRQRMDDDATSGVAVIWNRSRAHSIGITRDRPEHIGHGWQVLVEPLPGDDMLARGIVWQDLAIKGWPARVRIASTHRPPQRHRHLWDTFDDRLEAWLETSPIPVVVCMDANEAGGPNVDRRWRGIGIDGFLTDLTIPSVYELAPARSDHRPVSGAVRISTR